MRGRPHVWAAAALLVIQAALTVWGVTRNSVTFDETAHVASGVALIRKGNTWISAVNPPLIKLGYGAAALAAGAKLPAEPQLSGRDQFAAAEALMRANFESYPRVVAAARLVDVALALALSLVWLTARRLYGEAAGLFALALCALCPELLAHGGLATLDVATALFSFAAVLALIDLVRNGTWRAAGFLGAAFTALTLTRFTSWLVWGLLAALAAAAIVTRLASRPLRLAATTLALVPIAVLALHLGYLGETSLKPLGSGNWSSARFQSLAHTAPHLVIPLPDAYLAGLDHQMYESQGITPTYFQGRVTRDPVRSYMPVAAAVKWPLSLWAAGLLAVVAGFRRRAGSGAPRGPWFESAALLALPVVLFMASMLLVRLNVGVRYLLPALPALFVLAGSSLAPGVRVRGIRNIAVVLVAGAALETGSAAPWFLSFYNAAAGGPGNGDRIVNDSNVDVGQGLIALREEMARLGIRRIHLAYHGTVDPAIYGIDYVPYLGGEPGTESDWIAISSYYFVGLSQRMMTPTGRTEFVEFRFESLWSRPPAARPAHCMYLFRIR